MSQLEIKIAIAKHRFAARLISRDSILTQCARVWKKSRNIILAIQVKTKICLSGGEKSLLVLAGGMQEQHSSILNMRERGRIPSVLCSSVENQEMALWFWGGAHQHVCHNKRRWSRCVKMPNLKIMQFDFSGVNKIFNESGKVRQMW